MISQSEKASRFRNLHRASGAFMLPNPWDPGTARLLAFLGFEALATTSAGYAFSKGQTDGSISRDEMMRHLEEMAQSTHLPISADLENGFGDSPETVAETIRLAAKSGVVGGSIEDATGRPDQPLYSIDIAKERMLAAVEAARASQFDFVLTGRAENFIVGQCDLGNTIQRLQAYQDAGADVLFAPGLKKKEDIATVLGEIDRPLNVIAGLPGMTLNLSDLNDLGVKRVSVGGSLSRAALGAFLKAGKELKETGTFDYVNGCISSADINQIFSSS